jgi:ribose 5-phosphate isomerase RpiB
MKIAIGGDYAGFPLKEPIIELLKTIWKTKLSNYLLGGKVQNL